MADQSHLFALALRAEGVHEEKEELHFIREVQMLYTISEVEQF